MADTKADAPENGVHGEVTAAVGTHLNAPQEMRREDLPNSFYAQSAILQPSMRLNNDVLPVTTRASIGPQVKTEGEVNLTGDLGPGTMTGGVSTRVVGGIPGQGGVSSAVGATVFGEVRDVPVVETARVSLFGEASSTGADRDDKSVGLAVELRTQGIALGSSGVEASLSGGWRTQIGDSKFYPEMKFAVLETLSVTDHTHAEINVGTERLELSLGATYSGRTEMNTRLQQSTLDLPVDREPTPEQIARREDLETNGLITRGQNAGALSEPQVSLGVRAQVGDSTQVSSQFFIAPSSLGLVPPVTRVPQTDSFGYVSRLQNFEDRLGDRLLLDVTHDFSSTVQGNASALLSEEVQAGTVGVKYASDPKKDFSFFFSGEGGVVHYNLHPVGFEEAGPSGAAPVARLKAGFDF